MQILFVHGIGRTPISGLSLLFQCRKSGLATNIFGYAAALQDFASIRDRLSARIAELAAHGDYVLIGHSLGGVLIRSAISELPATTSLPQHVFLLGSPIKASLMAKKLRQQWLYRLLTGDCGQLLASDGRMELVPALSVPTTSVVGIKGLKGKLSPFLNEPNDGVVAASELAADWIGNEIRVPVMHTWLPSSRTVADIVLKKMTENS